MPVKKAAKSKVNAAGNYTKPGMRAALFRKIKAGSRGGDPGEWSARKAQLLAVEYKKAGGGYR
jgi:uncharacterized protein with WD repeat